MRTENHDPKDALRAAEIAVGENDLDTAEDAIHEALSRVRRLQAGGTDA